MNMIRENFRIALETLTTHKLMSALTILGVLMGTTCVVAIGSVLTGLDKYVLDELQDFGADSMFVFKFDVGVRRFKLTPEERMRKPLVFDDYLAVRNGCHDCREVSIQTVGLGPRPARFAKETLPDVELMGGLPDFSSTMNVPLLRGRFFTEAENQSRRLVAVIGSDVVKILFGLQEPLGKRLNVDGHTVEVIGQFDKRKTLGTGDENPKNKMVLIPYWTYRKLYPQKTEHLLVIRGETGRGGRAEEQVRGALRGSRKDAPGKPDSFGITTPTSLVREFRMITQAIALVILLLSSIGLLVGGVGVMNIMLVSVTERTREIGIRRAIGARRKDIMVQFLIEAVTLTGIGGLCGIAVGWAGSRLMDRLVAGIPTTVPLWSVVLGFGFSVLVGIVFGLWPAWRASRLDPVEALRQE